MLEISKQVFDEFKKNGILYCHFKSNEHLNKGLIGDTDLDVLVYPKDKEKCETVLLSLNFKQFEPVSIGNYPGVVNWYGYDKSTGKLIHLHLHYQLVTGKGLLKDYVIPWSDIILNTSKEDKETGVNISDPNLEYILLCTRLVVKRKMNENIKSIGNKIYIDNDIRIELAYLKDKISEKSITQFLINIYSKEYAHRILELIMKIEILSNREFKELERIIRTKLYAFRRYNCIAASFISFIKRFNRSLNRKINKHFVSMLPVNKRSVKRGVSIAFVGIDGSGKSTVSTEIKKWLGSEFDTIKFYAGAGDGKKNFLVSLLLKGYSNLRKTSLHDKKNNNFDNMRTDNQIGKISLTHKIKNLLGAMVYYKILKDNVQKIVKANKYCMEGCFCIMDRYPQSQIENEHDGVKISKYLKNRPFKLVRILAKKEKQLFSQIDNDLPKFDLLFKMNVDPEEAIRRKPDHDYLAMKNRAESLKQLSFSVKEVIEVNANDNLDDVILYVKEKIWNAI